MQAFIEDYLEWVTEILGDPGKNKRTTHSMWLRDLHAHHLKIFERLLQVSGDESLIGYHETDITLEDRKEFYSLPGNFRKFIGFERRLDGDPTKVTDRMGTVPQWSGDRGIVLLDHHRGFQVRPLLLIGDNQTWTLRYQKGPIHLHWGSVNVDEVRIGRNTFTLAEDVPAEQGTLINREDYYKGELIYLVETDQVSEVTAYSVTKRRCTLRHTFSPPPTGLVKYEFRTVLDRGIDKLFALAVAIEKTAARADPDKRRLLISEFKEFFASAKKYLRDLTSDRPPLPNLSRQGGPTDPFAG